MRALREIICTVTPRVPQAKAHEARRDLFAAGAILALSVGAAASLAALGRSTRTFAAAGDAGTPEVVVVPTGRDALAEWHRRGLRGRILVHAGRFLHFVEVPAAQNESPAPPGVPAAPDPQVGPRNYLRVAATSGVARRIVYVSPPGALDERLATLRRTRAELPVALPSEAFPRALLAGFPSTAEPVLLELSASWFDDPRAPDPIAALRGSDLRADLVVVNLAEDAEDVSEHARERARALASRIRDAGVEHLP